MEQLKDTLTEMRELFGSRMAEFENKLLQPPPASPTPGSLTVEFSSFKAAVAAVFNSLQSQIDCLASSVDSLEMRGRRKMLLIHGVAEDKDENTAEVLAKVICNKVGQNEFSVSDIKRCHRMGRPSAPHKPRPIVVKLSSLSVRDGIWFSKSSLKGSGITVSEFLTKPRHKAFMAAREKFGVSNSWTKEGWIHVLDSSGTKHRVATLAEVNAIPSETPAKIPTSPVLSESTSTGIAAALRPRRNVIKK